MEHDVEATTLTVSHCTLYRYATPVETAQHLATIRPRACPWQRVIAYGEWIDPAPSYLTSRVDGFGNDVLYFSLDTPHEHLRMTSEATVRLLPRWRGLDPHATPAWETVAHRLRYQAGSAFSPRWSSASPRPTSRCGRNCRPTRCKASHRGGRWWRARST